MVYTHATETGYIRDLGFEVIPPKENGEVTIQAADGRFMTFPDIPSFCHFSRNLRRRVEEHLQSEAEAFAKVVIESCFDKGGALHGVNKDSQCQCQN